MSDCKIYPADTVDIHGNVWETVGENIRNGLFGEHVKVGYINIDKGKVTSNELELTIFDNKTLIMHNINCFLVFTESIIEGGLAIRIATIAEYSTLRFDQSFDTIKATIKIIYADIKK